MRIALIVIMAVLFCSCNETSTITICTTEDNSNTAEIVYNDLKFKRIDFHGKSKSSVDLNLNKDQIVMLSYKHLRLELFVRKGEDLTVKINSRHNAYRVDEYNEDMNHLIKYRCSDFAYNDGVITNQGFEAFRRSVDYQIARKTSWIMNLDVADEVKVLYSKIFYSKYYASIMHYKWKNNKSNVSEVEAFAENHLSKLDHDLINTFTYADFMTKCATTVADYCSPFVPSLFMNTNNYLNTLSNDTIKKMVKIQQYYSTFNCVGKTLLDLEYEDDRDYLGKEICDYIDRNTKRKNIKTGAKAQDFEMTDLQGKKYNLSDFAGKYVIINFFTKASERSISANNDIVNKFKNINAPYINIALNFDKKKDWKKLIKKHKLDEYNLLNLNVDRAKFPNKFYEINEFPTSIIIDKEGRVLIGFIPLFMSSVEKYIHPLLK